MEQLLDLTTSVLEEVPKQKGGTRVKALRTLKLIDEVTVSLIGWYATSANVWLAEISLMLEGGHIVTDSGGRRPDITGRGYVLRSDGLRRSNVLIDHYSQYGGLTRFKFVNQDTDSSLQQQPSSCSSTAYSLR
jgi:hypothetical protein